MSKKRRVFIIDDDKVYTFGIGKLIKSKLPDNQVSTFDNGQDALDSISNNLETGGLAPELILLDLNMPKMNGWDFLAELEKMYPEFNKDIKVFVISSQVSQQKEEIYRLKWDKRVSKFIQKPVDTKALVQIIEE